MKKITEAAFFRPRFVASSWLIMTGVFLGMAALKADFTVQGGLSAALGNTHTTRGEHVSRRPEPVEPNYLEGYIAATPSTRSTFMATWQKVSGATGYRLDVSPDAAFGSYVAGYQNLDVGKASGQVVTGLTPGTKYFYRVRPYNSSGTAAAAQIGQALTQAAAGLNIVPTFDASITGNPNAAAIEACINRSIGVLENLFRDPITVPILFRYATTDADGTPLGSGGLARSRYGIWLKPWNTYLNALAADRKTSNDTVANTYLPTTPPPGFDSIVVSSANGRAAGLTDTPSNQCSDGSNQTGCPYDGIVTLNSSNAIKFTRPASSGFYDAQTALQHEMDEILGMGTFHDCQYCQNNGALRPADLFSWSAAGSRSNQTTGLRYFSINNGNTRIVDFNQQSNGDRGDWTGGCPHPVPRPNDAFLCPGQIADVSTTGAEGIHLDVIGFDLAPSLPRDRYDFNGDGKPDYVVFTPATRRTGIWYLNNSTRTSSLYGPTLPPGWRLVDVADFNRDGKADFLLYNPSSHSSAIWYLNNTNALIGTAYGPTTPSGWDTIAAADFNRDGKPDLVIYNASTHQTVIWYMNNYAYVSGVFGPTLVSGYRLQSVADFNRDTRPDYLLFNPSTRQTAIWYLNGPSYVSGHFGPTVASGYTLVGAADYNRDGKPDYSLFNPTSRNTVIWYLNNYAYLSAVFGPTISAGWTLIRP
jgi:hypothetical protein